MKPVCLNDREARDLQAAIMDAMERQGARIAAQMGMGHKNLLNAVNPSQPDVLHLGQVAAILRHCPNPGPLLRWICDQAHWLPVPLPKPGQAGGNAFKRLAEAAKQLGELSDALLQAYQDNRLTPAERDRVIKEARDLQQAAEELIQELQA